MAAPVRGLRDMDSKLQVLKLYFDALGIPATAEDVTGNLDSRLVLQKAMYLGQQSKVDLGYRFGWYVRGPYSSELTKDYYSMARALQAEEGALEGYSLNHDLIQRMKPIADLMQESERHGISKPNWLELLASYHYLRTVSKLDHKAAVEILKNEKNHLVPFANVALSALVEKKLLPE